MNGFDVIWQTSNPYPANCLNTDLCGRAQIRNTWTTAPSPHPGAVFTPALWALMIVLIISLATVASFTVIPAINRRRRARLDHPAEKAAIARAQRQLQN